MSMDRYTIFSGERSDEGAMLKRPVAAIAAPSVGDGDWRRIEHINALTRLARKSKSVAPNSKIASNFPFYVCCPKQPLHFSVRGIATL